MDTLKKIFPYSFKAKDSVAALVVNVIVYAVIFIVASAVIVLTESLPVIKLFAGLAGGLVDLYTTAGIVLSFLDYFKVIK